MVEYRIYETSISLLIAYETLALEYKAANSRREDLELTDGDFEKNSLSTNHYANYHYSFSLLILNASIIEGTLRSILSEKLSFEIEEVIQKRLRQSQTRPSRIERLLSKFRKEVETEGGWGKLKVQYVDYLDVSLEKLTSENIKEAINVLFVLRNVLAHGTAIVQPNAGMNDNTTKEQYPYMWQQKLQQAGVYLRKTFKRDNMFDNLSEYGVPAHFFEMTQHYFKDIEKALTPVPERAKKTIEMIDSYSFGFKHHSHFFTL